MKNYELWPRRKGDCDFIKRKRQMANTKKNALAELAERLTPGLVINVNGCVTAKDVDFDALQKAQRIVAELAKVEDKRDGETNSDALWRCNDCIAMCRVIAEEGERE